MIEFHLTEIKSFADYASNYTIIDAVERRLAIIGEALRRFNMENCSK